MKMTKKFIQIFFLIRKMDYFYLYCTQFFDISNSAGSLFLEAITLYKTFQRISAPKSFISKISTECKKLFNWAIELINSITNTFQTTPFLKTETFSVYLFVLPLTFMTFITSIYLCLDFWVYMILLGFYFLLGFGISYMEYLAIAPGIIGAGCTTGYFIYFFIKKGKPKRNYIFQIEYLTCSFTASFLIFYTTLIPIMSERWKLTLIVSCCIVIFLIIFSILEKKTRYTFRSFYNLLEKKLNVLLINCLTLFYVPSTELFIELFQNEHKNDWFVLASYLFISIVVPFGLILAMIFSENDNIVEKYRIAKCGKYNIYYFFEFFDSIFQILYAIAASFDVVWACLTIEIIWIILIFAVRHYKIISEYSLSGGNSLILIISNSVVLYSNMHNSSLLSYGASIFLVILACIPAIVSFYLFFIFDFDVTYEESDSDDSNKKVEYQRTLNITAVFLTPLSFFCFGLNLVRIAKLNE